jgi:hypothetical protein
MAQIMAVTGHKSASSVAVYQRVSTKEKQVMGDIITSSVRGEQPSQLSSIMPPHSTSRLVQICYGTAVEHGSLLNCSGVCDGINCCKSVIITK